MVNSVPVVDLNENLLLGVLSGKNYRSFQSQFEIVTLFHNQVLDGEEAAAGDDYVYFPLDAVVSLVSTMREAKAVELAMVGREGLTGIYRALGIETGGHRGVVTVPGKAVRVKIDLLREQLQRNAVLSALLMRYFHALHVQIVQAALCYRLHLITERLKTWLTMMFNRVQAGSLRLKQEEIARTLGYTRPTISRATAQLQQLEIIRYSRGRIELLDRPRLEQSNCECYRIMESNYERVLPIAGGESFVLKTITGENLSECANACSQQLDATVKRIREICRMNEAIYLRQREIINRR